MPRNSSGTYSLYTPGNPVVTSTVISSTWANNTLADLASALTDSLSRTGDGGMQAPLELTNGAIGAPSLTWASETTSGLYRNGAGDFRFSISAADVWRMTATGMVAGAATGGAQGAGTVNAQGLYVNGVAVTSGGANPTGTIGLTAVNGSAVTFLRSDGAPALSQSIAPTWTATHTFTQTLSGVSQAPCIFAAATPGLIFNATGAAADAKHWVTYCNATTQRFTAYNEAGSVEREYMRATRSGVAITDVTFGNSTDNPTFSFAGAGAATFGGVLLAADGSTSNAAYSNTGDPNTGIYFPSADDLWMTLGGTGYPVGYRSIPRSTTATTLVGGDLGKCVAVSAAIAIPASLFSAGHVISIYNDSGSSINITIAAGTLRLAGTTTTGTRTLAPRGLATLWFNVGGATPEVVASGSGLS